jgi:hypothetical protein
LIGVTGQPAESHVIVDTGSSAFVPLLHYVLSNEVQAILSQGGHQLVVHTVVTGGQALLDTLHGAAQLVKQMDAARFVIWLNPFWGPVADNGRTFEQMNLYEAIKKRIETIVSLPAFTDELFPQDIASMLKSRLTFKEAIESPDHSGRRLLLIVRKSSHHLLMECFLWHRNVVRALDTIEDVEVLCL